MATRAVRRRRSRPHLTPGTLITAASAAVACAALTSTHVLIWALITALVATVAYTLGRLHNQPPPRRARAEFGRRNRAAQRPGRAPGLPRSIRPPATPHLTTVELTPECAEGMHGICPRTGGCQCPCDHDSERIVAWNAAEYDRTHGKVPA